MKNRLRDTVKQDKKDFIKFIVFFIVIIAMIGVLIWLMPWIFSLKDEAGRAEFQEYIHSQGALGVLLLLGIQILQVVIAIIPGEPIEIIAGLLYGTAGGYFVCTIGMLIGTILVYYTVKMLGASFIHRLIGEGKLDRFKFLNDTKRLEIITFLLFFIPGTPKDMLTYVMPLTKIKPLAFFIISTVARIPSIISSTFAGASIGEGKWIQTVIIFVAIGVVAIAGIIINDRFMKKLNAKKESKDNG